MVTAYLTFLGLVGLTAFVVVCVTVAGWAIHGILGEINDRHSRREE